MSARLFAVSAISVALTLALAACGRLAESAENGEFAADASAEAASDAAACPGDSVVFQMLAWHIDGGGPQYCTNCGWLTIMSDDRQIVDRTAWCEIDCNGCSQRICPPVIPCPSVSLPIEGETTTWDGTYFAPGTCSAGTACSQLNCAKGGSHWIARMCATPGVTDGGLACSKMGPENCVDVPFDYPALDPVVGTLYPLR